MSKKVEKKSKKVEKSQKSRKKSKKAEKIVGGRSRRQTPNEGRTRASRRPPTWT
jgi:hypothetical protein